MNEHSPDVRSYLEAIRGEPLAESFAACVEALPLEVSHRLVVLMRASSVVPDSPAWIMFAVLAELLRTTSDVGTLAQTRTRSLRDDVDRALEEDRRTKAEAVAEFERAVSLLRSSTSSLTAQSARLGSLLVRRTGRMRRDRIAFAVVLAGAMLLAIGFILGHWSASLTVAHH